MGADYRNISTHPLLVKMGLEGPILRSQPLSLQSSPPFENETDTYRETDKNGMVVHEYRNNRLMSIQVLKLAAYQNVHTHKSFNNNDLIIRYKYNHILPFKETPAHFTLIYNAYFP